MVTNNNRMKYVYEIEVSTSDEESYADTDYVSSNKNEFPQRKSNTSRGRKPKCFTKNALLARENRLKKKMYLTNLENNVTVLKHENKKLVKVVNNQSGLISELEKQLRYFKSVVANSADISKLIRNIHQNTGMSVCSSLEKNLSLKNVCVPKPIQPIARKTAHPWEETCRYPSFSTSESNCFSGAETPSDDELTQFLNNIPLDFPLDIPGVENFPFKDDDVKIEYFDVCNDHNYTATEPTETADSDDVGVCLHVSKHRVSLEFCSSCNENAKHAWPN